MPRSDTLGERAIRLATRPIPESPSCPLRLGRFCGILETESIFSLLTVGDVTLKGNKLTQRGIGIIWFVIGLALLATGNTSGTVFFILGLVWMVKTTGSGTTWVEQNPRLARSLTVALVIICTLIVVISLLRRFGV